LVKSWEGYPPPIKFIWNPKKSVISEFGSTDVVGNLKGHEILGEMGG